MTKKTVYHWLDQIRERPEMSLLSLEDLQSQLYGYYQALKHYKIIEPVPQMEHHFLIWVHEKTGWGTSHGWAAAIEKRVSGIKEQLNLFFQLTDQYRQLVPVTLCTAELTEKNKPTGRCVEIGLNGRMERPDRVEIFQYTPEALHFFRFHYDDHIKESSLLMKHDGSHKTTLMNAKKWCHKELQIKDEQWKMMK